MDADFFRQVVPLALFILALFLLFSGLELLVLSLVEWLEHKHRDRVMAWLTKEEHRHHRLIRTLELSALILAVAGFLLFSEVLRAFITTPEITILSGVLMLLVTFAYYAMTHIKGRLSIHKRGDRFLYSVLSIMLYVFLTVIVFSRFPGYKNFVDDTLVNPVAKAVSNSQEDSEEQALLAQFRVMARQGACPYHDYRTESGKPVVRNFLYVATDSDLATAPPPADPTSLTAVAQGKLCSDGKNNFLLTESGAWYWVIVQ